MPSQVYSVMRVDMLASLVPFASQGDVEQIIVDAIKHSYLQVWRHPVSPASLMDVEGSNCSSGRTSNTPCAGSEGTSDSHFAVPAL